MGHKFNGVIFLQDVTPVPLDKHTFFEERKEISLLSTFSHLDAKVLYLVENTRVSALSFYFSLTSWVSRSGKM